MDIAVTVAVPAPLGVNTPVPLTVPIFDGLTDHLTDELKFPVPATVGAQAAVWVMRMEDGVQLTETDAIVGDDDCDPSPEFPLPPPQPARVMQPIRAARPNKFERTKQELLLRSWPINATPFVIECHIGQRGERFLCAILSRRQRRSSTPSMLANSLPRVVASSE